MKIRRRVNILADARVAYLANQFASRQTTPAGRVFTQRPFRLSMILRRPRAAASERQK